MTTPPDDTTEGELIRLRNRVAALEANGNELLARAEQAEAERGLLRETLAESDLGAQVLAQWEAIAAADADRDRLQTERDTNFSVLQRVSKGAWESATELVNERIGRKQAERELTEAKQAVYNARATHVREAHPTRLIDGNCYFCRIFVAIDRDMPSRPDDPEEIRRLAESTEQ